MRKYEYISMLPFSWLHTLNALLFLIILSLSCLASADAPRFFNVKDFGAQADRGKHDCDSTDDGDGPEIQQALDAAEDSGGGTVYLPAGTYFINQPLIVGDHTTVLGDGPTTIIKRGKSRGYAPDYNGEKNCETESSRNSLNFFTNSKYNCGNTGIVLKNFTMDGSCINDLEVVNAKQKGNAVAISFSAVKDTHIKRLYIYDVPQDAIFFRNGGIRNSVTYTMIDGFNMHWRNGAGINVEMRADGNYPGRLIVKNNTIVNRAPIAFCSGEGEKSNSCIPGRNDCDTSCEPSKISSINFNRPKNQGGEPAGGHIVQNRIWLNNKHKGIDCFACNDTKIVHNIIRPWVDPEVSFAEQNTSFVGIEVSGSNLTIMNNYIQGSGQINKDGVGIDGRGILVKAEVNWPDLNNTNLILSKNIVKNKRIKPGTDVAAIEVKGVKKFTVSSNRIEDTTEIPIQANGLVIGSCKKNYDLYPTVGGSVKNNLLLVPNDNVSSRYFPFILRGTSDIRLKNNKPSDNPFLQCGAEDPI